jgi:hypothetical protein
MLILFSLKKVGVYECMHTKCMQIRFKMYVTRLVFFKVYIVRMQHNSEGKKEKEKSGNEPCISWICD